MTTTLTDTRPVPIELIDTIRRLDAIKPGERVRYYSGGKAEVHSGNPVVEAIFAHAGMLADRGRVELKTSERAIPHSQWGVVHVTDFWAIGK